MFDPQKSLHREKVIKKAYISEFLPFRFPQVESSTRERTEQVRFQVDTNSSRELESQTERMRVYRSNLSGRVIYLSSILMKT